MMLVLTLAIHDACALSATKAVGGGVQMALLPGQASSASWPRFLFLFRGVSGSFRLAELHSAALTLGVDEQQLTFEAASSLAANLKQPEIADAGGDVGPDLLQWVALPSAEVATAVASRCSTVRGAFEVWATARFEPACSLAPAEAAQQADARWRLLADCVHADTAFEARARMLGAMQADSWRVDVINIGTNKPRSLAAKVALMETFDSLLGPLPGAVDLKSPAQIVTLIEDCREPDGPRAAARRSDLVQAPHWLGLGRLLTCGAAAHLSRFALSDRSYLGRTTLPPEYSYLMAIQARVLPGHRVLDPFCGTCSTLLSCAALGAITMGVEADARVLHGTIADGAHLRPKGSKALTSEPSASGIATNFAEGGLPPPECLLLGDMASFDALLTAASGADKAAANIAFDAIVTDPPYGLMEGLGALYVPLGQRLTSLLRLASRRLKLGGRLVFLLPLPAGADVAQALPDTLPTARCLSLERISRQRLSQRLHRLLVTMVKVAEPTTEAEGLLGSAEGAEAGKGTPTSSLAHQAPWEEWWRTVQAFEDEASSWPVVPPADRSRV
jgi:tRNA G10  N-methylase Trm11